MKFPPKYVIWILVLCFSTAIFAKTTLAAENNNDTRALRREIAEEDQLAKTVAKAKKKTETESSGQITFADVLKRPDDVELNFQFAKQQVASNDLLGASGTLERILAVQPQLHEIRLFYAVVLFRLDNLPEAEREINTLEKQPLSGALKAEWKKYKYEIGLRKKKTRFSVRESVGYEFDSNRNAAPSSKQSLFSDVRLDNSAENRRRSDPSFLNITSVDVTHDLGFQAGHLLLASFTYYLQEQEHIPSLDLGSFQYELGGTYKSKIVNFTPTFFASHVFLSDENYLRTQGGNFRFDRIFFEKLLMYANYRIEHQDYMPIKENETARQRTGVENGVSTGATYALTPSMSVDSGILYSYKNAKANYEGYDHWLVRLSHSWLLGHGQFLINGVEGGFDRYDEQDAAIATRFRRDNTFRYRVTYGAPLTFFQIGKVLPGPLKDIVASFSYEYYHAHSNITNYTYTNNKIQFLLTKRLEF